MTNAADRYRRWDELTNDEQEQIQTDPEHRNEDHARYRWKRAKIGDGWTWDKWQGAESP
jgi:hypothetical protein